MVYKDLIDQVIDHFSKQERYLQEIIQAKEVFFQKTGKVFEDDSFYETRMAAFVEWFILDRPLFKVGLTPVRYYFELFETELEEEKRQGLKALMKSLHSLFLFRGKTTTTVRIEDLFDHKRYEIVEKRQYVGIPVNSIFEGRVVQKGLHYMFSDAYCIHPHDASPLIRKEAGRRSYRDRDPFLEFTMNLAALRLRCDRYKKVNVEQIYDFKNGK